MGISKVVDIEVEAPKELEKKNEDRRNRWMVAIESSGLRSIGSSVRPFPNSIESDCLCGIFID